MKVNFQKSHYKKITSKEEVLIEIQKEGFSPQLIKDGPGYVYKRHSHKEAKLIVCVKGSMKVEVNGDKFNFEPGDRLLIPGNTPHSAIVGNKGCIYFWSEKGL